MTAREDALRETLRILARGYASRCPPKWVYDGPPDFVLQHGEVFDPIPLPNEFEYGPEKACFGNSLMLAEFLGLTYVEGYAFGPADFPIHHAWNVDDEGRLIDVTWSAISEETGERMPMPGAAYLGVRFSIGRADDATWNGDASVLDDWKRGWPILCEPWTGEDFEREWEPSEALAILRAKDRRAARELIARERL